MKSALNALALVIACSSSARANGTGVIGAPANALSELRAAPSPVIGPLEGVWLGAGAWADGALGAKQPAAKPVEADQEVVSPVLGEGAARKTGLSRTSYRFGTGFNFIEYPALQLLDSADHAATPSFEKAGFAAGGVLLYLVLAPAALIAGCVTGLLGLVLG